MARHRKTSILEDLIAAPWWVSFTLGVGLGIYLLITPAVDASAGITYVYRMFSKWGIGFLFICSFISFLLSFKRRAQFEAAKTLEDIRNMSWRDFETFVGEVFRRQGYSVEETGGGGADGGIDLIVRSGSEKMLVQCKQWRTYQVGVKIVREMYGLMMAEDADRVFIVSVGSYTKDAADFARGKPIELIDGDKLVKLRNEQGAGVSEFENARMRECANAIEEHVRWSKQSEVKPSAPSQKIPSCPRCNTQMVLRTAKKGANAGGQFWGCPRYPECKGIVNV
jgi:restriction system protein